MRRLAAPVRVVLAEDNPFLREGLTRLLSASGRIEVRAACGSLDELLAAVEAEEPDVVLTDIRMPPTGADEGIQAALKLRDSHPELGVVVLSQHIDAGWALDLFARGSERRAYLLKERVSEPGQLVAAIREVAAGGSVVDPKVVESLLTSRTRKRSALDDLTQREREVLGEIAQGKSNAAVAKSLFLSVRAVEKHINSLFSKLGLTEEQDVHRRVKAVLLYLSDEGG
jgi:DNA-binding NarL/FixJ family response regulator